VANTQYDTLGAASLQQAQLMRDERLAVNRYQRFRDCFREGSQTCRQTAG